MCRVYICMESIYESGEAQVSKAATGGPTRALPWADLRCYAGVTHPEAFSPIRIGDVMLEATRSLQDLERRWEAERYGAMDFGDALAVFAALWAEARALRPDLGADWREDMEPDLAVARAVNGLPPS